MTTLILLLFAKRIKDCFTNLTLISEIRDEYSSDESFWNNEIPTDEKIQNCIGRYVPSIISAETVELVTKNESNYEISGQTNSQAAVISTIKFSSGNIQRE